MMDRSLHGTAVRKLSVEQTIECNIWAWDQMPANVFRWAWVSRGLVSVEDMAAMNKIDVSEVMLDIEHGRKNEDPCFLRTIPTLEPPSYNTMCLGLAVGEHTRAWQVCSDGGWEFLPDVLGNAIDRELACYRKEERQLLSALANAKPDEVEAASAALHEHRNHATRHVYLHRQSGQEAGAAWRKRNTKIVDEKLLIKVTKGIIMLSFNLNTMTLHGVSVGTQHIDERNIRCVQITRDAEGSSASVLISDKGTLTSFLQAYCSDDEQEQPVVEEPVSGNHELFPADVELEEAFFCM